MQAVAIVSKNTLRLSVIAILVLGVLCISLGYRLAGMKGDCKPTVSIQSPPITAMEKWVALSIQQAKPGDFAITKDGNVIKLGGLMHVVVVERDLLVSYDTRFTSGGYYKKPLLDMAREVARVVKSDDKHRHNVINLCFYTGARVTTSGPEALTCNV